MDRFHQIQVYVAVAEEQGFAAAARRLRLSPPAVTRAIASLEQHLGITLLERTTRQMRITEAGQRYLEDARRILADLDQADEAAAGINAQPRGQLAVTAPVLFGRMFVMPGISEFLNRYPQVNVSAVFLDRVVNLLEEGLDVGVRIGELADSSMRALRVGSVRHVLCAAPAYLRKNGQPQAPADLHQHQLIASSAGSMAPAWRFVDNGDEHFLPVKPRLAVTTNDAAIEAALEGVGISRLLSYQVAAELEAGTLQVILAPYEPPPLPIHIVHRAGPNSAAKVRSFIDLLAQHLRNEDHLN